MAMKAINVTEFKAHLSKYLRMASRGSQILVKDRDEPIAQSDRLRQRHSYGMKDSRGRAAFEWARKPGGS